MKHKLNLRGIPDYYRARQITGKSDAFPYQGIWIFSGSQGAGKTLNMMQCVLEMHEQYPDALIVSNISIFGLPCIPYKGVEDFDKYKNGDAGVIFVVDEIHTIWNSIESKNMPPATLKIWSQNRKNRRVILGTSQRYTRVAKGLREQAYLHIETRRPILCFYRYCVVDASLYDDQGKYTGDRPPSWSFYVPRLKAMLCYNTMEVVNACGNNGMEVSI